LFTQIPIQPSAAASIGTNSALGQATTQAECHRFIAEQLAVKGRYEVKLSADAGNPNSEAVADFGQGCQLVTRLEFHSSGGAAVRRQLEAGRQGTTTATAYPTPSSPATTPGADPYCKQKSYALDVLHLETWVVEAFQFWDNYASVGTPLVNAYATQNATPDPFFVVTANSVTDSWINQYWDVQGAGHAAFHSDAGNTNNGVDSYVRAQASACQGNSSFFGPTTPGGSFGRDPVVGPVQ